MKDYEKPNMKITVFQTRDVLSNSGYHWSNQPDIDDNPGEDGGVDAGDQMGDLWGNINP